MREAGQSGEASTEAGANSQWPRNKSGELRDPGASVAANDVNVSGWFQVGWVVGGLAGFCRLVSADWMARLLQGLK